MVLSVPSIRMGPDGARQHLVFALEAHTHAPQPCLDCAVVLSVADGKGPACSTGDLSGQGGKGSFDSIELLPQ